MAETQKAVVIIPTYNEKGNISRLIPVLMDVFSGVSNWDLHILIVDDNSPDGTGAVVSEMGKRHKNIHLFTNEKKQGLGHAYLVGMIHAFDDLKADAVFEMDADFSHDPLLIPKMLSAVDNGADMVLGSRYIPGGSIPEDWGFTRKFLSVVGNMVNMVVLTDFRIRDWTTGYRLIKKKVFSAVREEMGAERFSGYTFQIGFLHKAVRHGFTIKEIPLKFVDRTEGKSKLGSEYLIGALEYIITARMKEIVHSRFFKFAIVGGVGFIVNTIGLFVFSSMGWVQTFALSASTATGIALINAEAVASALGAELAIISNFTWNNLFTFSDRKLKSAWGVISKFVQFNLASLAAVLIQFVIVGFGTELTGNQTISKMFWLILATGVVMIVNFIVYSKFIWKKKPATK